MRLELPIGINFDSKDEKRAAVLLLLIHRKLSEPKYVKKLQEIVNEAHEDVVNYLKK